ncbi:MAG: SLBB domain-containing protein, partial [Fervidobacterium sp.]
VKSPVVTVYVSQYAPMYIFIQGVLNRTFDISFLPEVTLSKLFSYLNITKSSEVDFTNVRITKKGKTDTYNMMGYFYDGTIAKDPVIEEGDIIYLPPLTYDKAVQISGAYTYSTPYEPGLTLRTLLLKLGPLNKDIAQIESAVLVVDNKAVTINLEDVIYGKIDYALKQGSTLYIPKRDERYVYVIGYVPSTGIKTFLPTEQLTLNLALAKAGGIAKEDYKWVESILITTPDGKVQNYDSTLLSKANEVKLTTGTVIEIRKYPEFKIYVTGDFAQQSTVTFDPDEPRTLSQLFVKIGGLKTDQMKWIESVKINNQAVDMSKLSTYTLKDKDIVEIKKYPEFYVYVQGLVNTKGKIVFEPGESKTLKLLVAKVGLPSEDIENEGYATINNSSTIDLKDVIYGSKDYELSLGDIVQITYDPFIVNTIGTSVGTVQLTYKEPRTLSYLIKKLGILQPESIEKVLLIRDGKQQEYAINQLLYDQISVPLAKYDTVILKQAETNAVYLTGDVAAYVTFAYNEPITMQRVLAKVGLSDLRKIEKITNGDTSIDFTKDLAIQKGAILNVQLKKPIYVTAMGYIKNTGRVSFDYYETADLQTLFAKLGGLIISPDEYYVSDKISIVRQDKILEYDAQRVFKGLDNLSLEDGDFVYVTESTPKQVYVFGKGMQNGLVRFTQSEDFDLRTLIGKLGGIKEGTSKDIAIIGDESTKITWNEYVNLPLKPNSTILFDVDTKNYIYVVDPTGKPNMIYTDRDMTLYEVLSKVGMSKNYGKIELTSGTTKQLITLKAISEATGYNVKPGDIVRISDASMNFVYVLGEVKNPGVVQITEGMTVLQAVIQSGYFTAKAVPSTVWLYKGGIDGQAVKINLSAVTSGGNVDLTTVEPGDVVFVPADMFKTAADWISTIAPLVTMFSTIYGLFN